MTENEFKLYLALGLCAPGVWGGQKEATMYSYNGVVLPKLPEWDKTVYPYAYLTKPYGSYPYLLRYLNINLGPVNSFLSIKWENADGLLYLYRNGVWSISSSIPDSGNIGCTNFIWTNTDILNYDKTVFLPSSDPIPVYE